MSTNIGTIKGRKGAGAEQGAGLRREVFLTRFAGGGDGVCLQVTVGDQYVQLDSGGVGRLRGLLDEWMTLGEEDS
jgi:hypothetical protein